MKIRLVLELIIDGGGSGLVGRRCFRSEATEQRRPEPGLRHATRSALMLMRRAHPSHNGSTKLKLKHQCGTIPFGSFAQAHDAENEPGQLHPEPCQRWSKSGLRAESEMAQLRRRAAPAAPAQPRSCCNSLRPARARAHAGARAAAVTDGPVQLWVQCKQAGVRLLAFHNVRRTVTQSPRQSPSMTPSLTCPCP
jgi:hypothetical protein